MVDLPDPLRVLEPHLPSLHICLSGKNKRYGHGDRVYVSYNTQFNVGATNGLEGSHAVFYYRISGYLTLAIDPRQANPYRVCRMM